MFDKPLYIQEMTAMVDKAIERIINEKPDFKIYTASIWTDPNVAMSAISFDSKENSLKSIATGNQWGKELYDASLAAGDLEMAELQKPIHNTRMGNPADYDLRDYELISHRSFPKDWESDTEGTCWEQLGPALTEIGSYYFLKSNYLNTSDGFELSINSAQDWYDKTWQ